MNFDALKRGAATTKSHLLKPDTVKGYNSAVDKFAAFCAKHDKPDPRLERFSDLPKMIQLYMELLSHDAITSKEPAEKTRAALAYFYSKDGIRDEVGNGWIVRQLSDGQLQGFGNLAKTDEVRKYLNALGKKKKGEYESRQAHPISLPMLTKLHDFLDGPRGQAVVPRHVALWFKAVPSTAFYLMARIDEVFEIRACYMSWNGTRDSVPHGAIALTKRKTSTTEGRSYHVYGLLPNERAIDAMYHV